VLHAAGVIEDGSISTQDWSRFAGVLRPKAFGAQILDQLTRKDPLDWFVMFSSAASIVGSPGQANYAAANTFLDVLAHERRRLGRPAQSINWGSWQEIGLSAGDRMQERVRSSGLIPMSPRQGLSQLEAAMVSDSIQLGVLNADWRKLVGRRSAEETPAYFSSLVGSSISRKSNGAADNKIQNLRELVEAAPPSRRRSVLRNYVRDRAIEVLGQKDKGLLDDQTPLRDFGLDSLLAVELRNSLSRSLGTSLPATLLFDYSTVGALTNFIWTEVLDGSSESDQGDTALAEIQTGSAVLMSVTEMSDEDVERLLAAKQ
jgi:acyl carrier protein